MGGLYKEGRRAAGDALLHGHVSMENRMGWRLTAASPRRQVRPSRRPRLPWWNAQDRGGASRWVPTRCMNIEFAADGSGDFAFGCAAGQIFGAGDGNNVAFSWQGNDEMDKGQGNGWVEIQPESSISGRICFHGGDEADFADRKWTCSAGVTEIRSAVGTDRDLSVLSGGLAL